MNTILTTVLVITNALFFGLVTLLHVYWALGGSWALTNALPQQDANRRPAFQPSPLMTLAVAGVLLVGVLLNLNALPGLISHSFLSDPIRRYSLLVIGLFFSLRTLGDFKYVGLTKRILNTPFAEHDTNLYTPLCGALAISHFVCYALLS